MKCVNCNREFEGNFCPDCGTKVVFDNRRGYDDFRNLLIDSSEKIVTVIGNNCAKTFISTGVVGNGFAILTDKRVYFKGKVFFRKGKGVYSKLEEKTVDIDDVTGTGFAHNKATWAKVLYELNRILCMLFCFILCVQVVGYLCIENWGGKDNEVLLFGLPLIYIVGFALFAYLFKFLYKRYNYSLFEISYAGGNIAFDMHWITEQESNAFQRQIVLIKQNKKSSVEVGENDLKGYRTQDIQEQIRKFKELAEEGIITQEEYNQKKRELLNL